MMRSKVIPGLLYMLIVTVYDGTGEELGNVALGEKEPGGRGVAATAGGDSMRLASPVATALDLMTKEEGCLLALSIQMRARLRRERRKGEGDTSSLGSQFHSQQPQVPKYSP
ncbi:hypothetical protein E2562_038713 [Oryza meyeriana var. granulata]|uniref:Uncharacterized protein n=1 Tax=Oryza meyeriana var. granulata TaxID=110450 RepID=A0A6G1DTL1_9ORYZ|nr:hypothetical protein E2562_038713 [Oryza meyeriana var. granulata]